MSEFPKSLKLNNGLEIPTMGLGTTRLRNMNDANFSMKESDRNKGEDDVVYNSIKHGVRLIDTASKYENEVEVGKGIKRAIDEGIVKREDLFVITKMWLDEKENPEKALRQSLERLNLSYVDLYLDHWPSGKCYNGKNNFKLVSIRDIWKNMEKLVELNLTKSIGVSNYNVQNLSILLSICKIKPVVDEVEFHPYLYQKDLKEFCDLEDIKIISYYPLIKGINFKNRFEKISKDNNLDLLNEEIIVNLSKKYNKTVGQIILNWHLHLGLIPIPGTSSNDRMKENLGAFDFKMDETHDKGDIIEDLDTVDGLGDAADSEYFVADLAVGAEIDVGIFSAGGLDLLELDLFQCALTAGRLFGLGGVGGEAGDEFLELLDLFLFFLIGFLHLTDQKTGGFIPEIVVARIERDLSVINVCNVGADLVEEIAVVGDDNDCIGEVDQKFLQPVDGVQIQMVGGLVEEQNIGIAEQSAGKQDLDLLCAGDLAHQISVKLGLDPETVEQGFCVGLGLPAVHLGKLGLEFAGADTVLIGEVLFGIESILLGTDLEQAGIALNDRIENDLVIIFVVVLFQEGETLSLGNGDTAAGGLKLTGQDPEEGGLAGPVCADDAVAVSLRKFNGNIFKQSLFSQAECDTVCLNHILDTFLFQRLQFPQSGKQHKKQVDNASFDTFLNI